MKEYSALRKLHSVLNYSPSCYKVATVFLHFAELFETNSDQIVQESESVAIFISPFINDIIMWKNMVFIEGAPSIDFLNDSFQSNIDMIDNLLHPSDEDPADDLDNIFDF